MIPINYTFATCAATIIIFFIAISGGDALEFPRKGYRFPLKRNVPIDTASNFDESSEDLVPLAQSYFITPEAPSTTTIKPTFKRRSTLQPITSWGGEAKSKKSEQTSEIDTSTNNYNPFRQIVDTGFQAKKSFSNKKRRPSSIDMMRRDQNVNEGGAPFINIESTSTSNYEKDQEAGNKNANKKFGGRKKPKKVVGYTTGVSSPLAKISSPRPQRYIGQRRQYPVTIKSNVEDIVVLSSESPSTIPNSTPRGSFSRSGRQFGRAPRAERVEPVEIQPQFATTDNKPLRRRKKFTTTSTSASVNVNDINQPGGGQPPATDQELQRINSNVFANRKPFALGRGAAVTLNPVDNIQVQQDSAPLNRRMRHRPAPARKTLLTPVAQDSEHESSSDAITVFADSGDTKEQMKSTDLGNNDDNSNAGTSDNLPPSRNLSNRRPNPLDKLSNRQAAARRFLTPKKSTDDATIASSTTKSPLLLTTSRIPRKSPLSLANLRNRRLGGASSTTTTETPAVVEEDPKSHEVLGNLDALDGTASINGTQASNGTDTGDIDATSKDEAKPVENEEPKSQLSGLLRNRRPPLKRPLPGANSSGTSQQSPTIHIKPRGPNLKPRTTESTTPKPLQMETTTPPTCEDGKRYNKILRKCIPAFKSG